MTLFVFLYLTLNKVVRGKKNQKNKKTKVKVKEVEDDRLYGIGRCFLSAGHNYNRAQRQSIWGGYFGEGWRRLFIGLQPEVQAMVFESLVSDLLNRFIGDYVENLDKSQLKIGIWGGELSS